MHVVPKKHVFMLLELLENLCRNVPSLLIMSHEEITIEFVTEIFRLQRNVEEMFLATASSICFRKCT